MASYMKSMSNMKWHERDLAISINLLVNITRKYYLTLLNPKTIIYLRSIFYFKKKGEHRGVRLYQFGTSCYISYE